MKIRKGEVVALGLISGECPVGMVSDVSIESVRLELVSFLTGHFGIRTEIIRKSDVERVIVARRMDKREILADGWCEEEASKQWFDIEPLGDFQTKWRKEKKTGNVTE